MTWPILYAVIFLLAFGLSAALCALARRVGLRVGLMDRPSGRKAHAQPVAVTGGWGFFSTFLLLVLAGSLLAGPVAGLLPPGWDEVRRYMANIAGVRTEILAVLAGATLLFALGAIDDVRPLGPRLKLTVQVLAVLPLLLAGITVRGFLPLPLGWLLSLFWIVLLTNSFNLLDNMDGLSATIALVICAVLSVAALQGGERWLPALFLCLAGALAGFLCYNFHPATIFMGDAGSLVLGYLMGVFSILVTYYEPSPAIPTGLPILMPLAIMGVPLFDTLSVIFIRWRTRRPILQGDRNHFSHRLLAMGFSVRQAAVAIALLTAATGLLALPLRRLAPGPALLHLLALGLLFAVIIMLEIAGRRGAMPGTRADHAPNPPAPEHAALQPGRPDASG
ncbi:MAG: putative undecaprenyl-phosphate N-acetylglucosaminyl 1-phosphate transferase [candidate division BRC1 bacterium ADurb.BinA292]|nr:MAG: putative undecaprenyl-phosphate N-acetylglucosaminyl 1-phosphate transferase [candidate division BRC1 bacterium ADurb.BinA292]